MCPVVERKERRQTPDYAIDPGTLRTNALSTPATPGDRALLELEEPPEGVVDSPLIVWGQGAELTGDDAGGNGHQAM